MEGRRHRRVAVALALLILGCTPRWRAPEEGARAEAQRPATAQASFEDRLVVAQALGQRPRSRERVDQALEVCRELVADVGPDAATRDAALLLGAELSAWSATRAAGDRRQQLARWGVECARDVAGRDPSSARARYLLAVCLGLYADTDRVAALSLIAEAVEHAEAAAQADAAQDDAGPHRFLARVYAQAPSYPTSVGDLGAAIEHGEAAVKLAPGHPGNRLALAAALIADDDAEAAAEHVAAATAAIDAGSPTDDWQRARWRDEVRALTR